MLGGVQSGDQSQTQQPHADAAAQPAADDPLGPLPSGTFGLERKQPARSNNADNLEARKDAAASVGGV
jgi:hypothetical protein